MSFLGADTDELRDAGQVCQDGKETTDQVIAYLRALIAILRAASFFSGGASAAYATYLETVVVPWLQKISMALGLFAQVLNANAEAQDQASNGQSVDFGSLPTYPPQTTGDSSVTPFTGSVIGQAVAAIGVVGAIANAIDAIDGDQGTGNADSVQRASGPTTIGHAIGVDGTNAAHAVAGDRAHVPDGGQGVGGGHAPTGGGAAGGGAAAPAGGHGSLGASTIGGSAVGGDGVNADGTPTSHESGSTAGGFGGATPGADTLGHTGDAAQATGGSPSYGAAAGIAGGAAAAGIGGAALAARSSGGDQRIDQIAGRNGRGSSGAEVRELQQRLTESGYDTKGVDGQWGPNTQAAFDAYRADHPMPVQAGSGYTSPSGYDYNRITGVRGNANVTPEFLRGVEGVAQRVGARPEHLLAAMSFETGGTFAADVRNPHSSATGLIQFMDTTARGLGTTTADLARMTPTEQLTYVERYFEPFRGRLGDLESVYTSILSGHPHAAGETLFSQGSAAYAANAPLDFDHDGRITTDEATSAVRRRMGGQ
ncbi:peptidoglycan-binding domain-containing protein [Nocardioides aquiterrae]|uniref:Peptidoglycan binding-like domain-containing protein n=1 Tax=Nocardioides aquiterrae TaxID=203799 RepID=A0ABP4FEL4_9ACTN